MVGLCWPPALVSGLLDNSTPHNEARKKAPNNYKEGQISGVNVNETEGCLSCQNLYLYKNPFVSMGRNSTEVCEH